MSSCQNAIEKKCNPDILRRISENHQGTSYTSFYLFFSSTFLFTMAGTLLSTGVWCFLVRLPMIHLARGPSRIVILLSGYIFAAGALTLPASCILYREHNVTRGHYTLLPMMIMLCTSTIFLICGATHGIIYRKSHFFSEEFALAQDEGLLISQQERAALLFGTLPGWINTALTSRDYLNYSSTWDLMQTRLECCGINDASDWTRYPGLPELPQSCYSTSLDEDGKRSVWKTGCLDAIALDLAWITAYMVGLCFMSIPSHILAIVSAGILLQISKRTSISND
ncbi:PREDICTED: tetraspanin-9-like isoform X2 [Trachymyrmex septentrionalis]|uniref:tetraspanin-9-like isoform X2 n=1 Tax=Trachymyrmex septentrionalis TaxID=34720 RepID=UPI00084F0BE3|nr:PREDICTED: tetraspanin-9-like isoform X2 [Trachymyrmex septentrionalis]